MGKREDDGKTDKLYIELIKRELAKATSALNTPDFGICSAAVDEAARLLLQRMTG